MAESPRKRQEPLRDLILDYTGLAWSRHFRALRVVRGPLAFSGSLGATFGRLAERPYLSREPQYEAMRDRVFRLFGPGG